MLTFVRTVTADAPIDLVYGYLSDFRSVNQWDPRASEARRVAGDGGAGTTYSCEVAFARRTVTMRYRVGRLEPDELITWDGESPLVRAHDEIRLRSLPDGTEVEYLTQYRYLRAPWLMDRLFRRSVERLCDDARDGLQEVLAPGGSLR